MIRRAITALICILAFNWIAPTASAVNYGIPLGPPGAPRNITAANVDATTSNVSVTWQYPTTDPSTLVIDNGGDTITGYVALALQATGETWTATSFSCSTPAPQPISISETASCTISGLSYGTRYKFQVSASNSFGTASAISSDSVLTNSLSQTVSITPSSDQTKTVIYGTGDFRLYATSTGAPTITWQSQPTSICTVDSLGVVHPVAVGTCYVNAVQDGVGTAYLPAMDTATITVSPNLSATIQPASNIQGTNARLNAIIGFPGLEVSPIFCISDVVFSGTCPTAPGTVTIGTPTPSIITATSANSIYATASGLAPGQTYYFNAKVEYGGSTVYSNTETFTTSTGLSLSYSGSLTGIVGTPMSGILTVTGGSEVYSSWLATSLPTGLSFTPGLSTATISGTPTVAGRFSTVFLVTDSTDTQKEDDEIFVISASNSDTETAIGSTSNTNPNAQIISVTNVPNPAYLAYGPLVLNASASSGLPLTYASSTPLICKVSSAGVVTYLGLGTCTILINQTGNSWYLPAVKTISFTIDFKLRIEIDEPTNVQSNSAKLNANAPWPGYDAQVKFCVSKSEKTDFCNSESDLELADPTPSIITTLSGGIFSALLNGLVQNTNYYVWAIENSHGQSASSLVRKIHTPDGPTILFSGQTQYKLNEPIALDFKATGGAGGYKNWHIIGLPTNITSTSASSVLKVRGRSSIEARYFLKVYVEDRTGASSTITEVLTITNNSGRSMFGAGNSGTSQITEPGYTNISWLPEANAKLYEVLINGKIECSTELTSCIIKRLVGPKSNVAIVTHSITGKASLPEPIRYLPPIKPVKIAIANFDLNKSSLKPKDLSLILKVAKLMEEQGYTSIQVIGHTDSTGSAQINVPLSEARAKAVFKYLQKILTGTPVSVELIGKSSTEPVATNSTDLGRAANRRAVLYLK